jgi:hypothetical protein
VVVGGVANETVGELWVQDSGGGPSSGILVYCAYGATSPSCKSDPTSFKSYAVGHVVDITGVFNTHVPARAPATASQLRIDGPTITPTDMTATPIATPVPAAMLDKRQLSNTEYHGTYVQVAGPFVATNLGATEFQLACRTPPVTDGGTSQASDDGGAPPASVARYVGFEMSVGSATVAVSLDMRDTLGYCVPDSCQPPGHCALPITANQIFPNVQGIVEPHYDATSGEAFLRLSPVLNSDL